MIDTFSLFVMLYKVYQLQYYSFDNFPQFSKTKLKPSVHDDRTLTIKELQDGVNFYTLN